jgi:hypothetical protein
MSGLRSVPVKGRSSSPGGVSAAVMMATAAGEPHEADADADADADDGEDSDVFFKDESSSPDPENEKPRFAERRPPSKLSSGGRRIPSALAGVKSSKSASKAASVFKGGIRSPPPSPNPIIPRRAEDWEPWKTVLHDLYITQNRILRDIIIYMETTYNLRAT